MVSKPESLRTTVERARGTSRRSNCDHSADSTDDSSAEKAVAVEKSLFSRMVNLRILESTQKIEHGLVEVMEALGVDQSGITLEKLSLCGSTYGDLLTQVLRTQPELKELSLRLRRPGDSECPFTPDLVPGLVTLQASLLDAAAIVPGRPVRALDVCTADEIVTPERNNLKWLSSMEQHCSMLAQSTSGITDLTFSLTEGVGIFRYMDLRWVPRYLPRVERLSFDDLLEISDDAASLSPRCCTTLGYIGLTTRIPSKLVESFLALPTLHISSSLVN